MNIAQLFPLWQLMYWQNGLLLSSMNISSPVWHFGHNCSLFFCSINKFSFLFRIWKKTDISICHNFKYSFSCNSNDFRRYIKSLSVKSSKSVVNLLWKSFECACFTRFYEKILIFEIKKGALIRVLNKTIIMFPRNGIENTMPFHCFI